ncbi:MAG: cation-transporting P-type ATPase [Pseudomonadota bacterium]
MNEAAPPSLGLTTREANTRLKVHGPNTLKGLRSVKWHEILLRQFASTLILILLFAAIVAGILGEFVDAIAIAAIVILNGALGFVQEWRAENTLQALRSLLAETALVFRDGREQKIDVKDVVPGDLVIVEAGDRVPADIVLSQALALRVDEAVLTGESEPVAKVSGQADEDQDKELFMGTSVVHGRGTGLVRATGMQTEFGRIAALTGSVHSEPTSLQRKLGELGRQLGLLAFGLCLLVVVTGVLTGKDLAVLVLTGLSLAVAVVPEGLPAVVTVTLALGATAMTKRRALARRLQAIETLGAASVICTDKTGTLTENKMTVSALWCGGTRVDVTGVGYDPIGVFEVEGAEVDPRTLPSLREALNCGFVCSHAHLEEQNGAWQAIGEPTELALVVAALKAFPSQEMARNLVGEFPFSSERKMMSVIVTVPEGFKVCAKGAPEAILPLCTRMMMGSGAVAMTSSQRSEIQSTYEAFADNGNRVLALAIKTVSGADVPQDEAEADLIFLGLAAIIDPPRTEVPKAVASARRAGIDIVMITGDAPRTAAAIGNSIGLEDVKPIMGEALDAMSSAELTDLLKQGRLFARTTPEHKLRIVECLQDQDAIVAMTGDGVNDAPALRKADIGIAMGIRGTDVSKDVADLVLLDDNFATIVAAIEEGRRQYTNIKKFVRYLLTSNAGEVVAIIGSLIIGGPLIFLPIHILWMNLITDGPTALTLGLEKGESDIMKRPPRHMSDSIIGRDGLFIILIFALYTGTATLFAFYSHLEHGVLYAQTVAFTTMILLEKFSVFAFRSFSEPVYRIGFFSNPLLLLAVTATVALQCAAVYWPPLQAVLSTTGLAWDTWILIIWLVTPVVVVPEILKFVREMLGKREDQKAS